VRERESKATLLEKKKLRRELFSFIYSFNCEKIIVNCVARKRGLLIISFPRKEKDEEENNP